MHQSHTSIVFLQYASQHSPGKDMSDVLYSFYYLDMQLV